MPKSTITITGHVVKPEMRYTPQGTAFLKFSIPIEAWSSKAKDGFKEAYNGKGFTATAWMRFVMFGKDAEETNEWLEHRAYVSVECTPNGTAENGTMTPNGYKDKSSYDWLVRSITALDDEKPVSKIDKSNEVAEDEIPF